MNPVVAAADLLLGAHCPGCGEPGIGVCRSCAEQLRPEPQLVHARHASDVPIWSSGRYEGVLRRVIVQWKADGAGHAQRHLTSLLARVLAAAVAGSQPGEAVCLVPVPSTRAARMRRGASLVEDLAGAAAATLREHAEIDVTIGRALSWTTRTLDQKHLSARDRLANLSGALTAAPRLMTRGDLIVVDDVVTTGATAAEAVRALRSRGLVIHSVAALAATP